MAAAIVSLVSGPAYQRWLLSCTMMPVRASRVSTSCAMVRLTLAQFVLEKFGGDNIAETRRNAENYLASWPEHLR